MRPIKFRGKAVMAKVELDYHDIPNYKGWIKGSLIVDGDGFFIVGNVVEASEDGLIHEWWAKVHPESVGQYTGLTDKNGREIYEGDVIDIGIPLDQTRRNFIGEVKYCTEFACFRVDHPNVILISEYDNPEVIGNIYENPELLEELS